MNRNTTILSLKQRVKKKEYYDISATAVQKWDLTFKAVTSTVMNTILTHFNDQSGGYHNFSWQSVPDYINSGANITGRWIKGSLRITPNSNKWKITVSFEKEN
jgi:phage-related protein